MKQHKTHHHVIFGSAMLLVLFVALAFFVVSMVQANPI
jgi:hypothetical protein